MTRTPCRSHSVRVDIRFGFRLRALRLQRNMTQAEMSEAFGIDRSFISDVERGAKSPSLPTLNKIAVGLKLSLSDLVAGV